MSVQHRRRTVWWVIGGVAAVLVIAGVAGGGASSSHSGSSPAPSATAPAGSGPQHPEDVSVRSCGADQYGLASASLVVTNHSSKPSTYSVTVTFVDRAGRQLGTGYVYVDQLAPGQSSTPQEAGSPVEAPSGSFVCTVVEAMRTASA